MLNSSKIARAAIALLGSVAVAATVAPVPAAAAGFHGGFGGYHGGFGGYHGYGGFRGYGYGYRGYGCCYYGGFGFGDALLGAAIIGGTAAVVASEPAYVPTYPVPYPVYPAPVAPYGYAPPPPPAPEQQAYQSTDPVEQCSRAAVGEAASRGDSGHVTKIERVDGFQNGANVTGIMEVQRADRNGALENARFTCTASFGHVTAFRFG